MLEERLHVPLPRLPAVVGAGIVVARPTLAAVAELGEVLLLYAVAGQEPVHVDVVDHAAAGDGQHIGHEGVDARIDAGQVAHGVHVAGLADEGEAPALVEQRHHIDERRHRAVARARAREHRCAVEAHMVVGAHGSLPGGGHVEDALDRARLQEVAAEGGQPAARRRLEADLLVRGVALIAGDRRADDRIDDARVRPVVMHRAVHMGARAHRDDARLGRGVERRLHLGPHPAGVHMDHLDPVTAGEALADAAAGAQAGLDDSFERRRLRHLFSVHRFALDRPPSLAGKARTTVRECTLARNRIRGPAPRPGEGAPEAGRSYNGDNGTALPAQLRRHGAGD